MVTIETPVTRWLFDRYMAWQQSTGSRQTVVSFARHLGVSRVALTRWMSGAREVSPEMADVLASKLGPEIYDLLGMPRPDPIAQALIANWGKLTDEQLGTIKDWLDRISSRGENRGRSEESRSSKKVRAR